MNLRGVVKNVAGRMPLSATVVDYVRFRLAHLGPSADVRPSEKEQRVLGEIARNGFTVLERYMSPDACARCIEDFERSLDTRAAHVQKYSDLRLYGLEEVAESIRTFANDPFLARLSDLYSGVRTVNAVTLANRVDAHPTSKGSGEGWHKDSSFRQFKAILYLNEVTADNGPFQVIQQSHRLRDYLRDMQIANMKFRHLRVSDDQIRLLTEREPHRLCTPTGGPGTLVLVDTASIHRGCPPKTGRRYALTNYFVEPRQITREFIDAYAPIPERVAKLEEMRVQA